MHICVGKINIIGSDNGRRQAILWTNAGILLTEPLEINFSETLIRIHTFSFMKMHLKMSSVKWRPFCLDLSVLTASVTAPKHMQSMPYKETPLYRIKLIHQVGSFFRQKSTPYDDVITKHFLRYWYFVRGIQWSQALIFSLVCSLKLVF